MKLSAISSMTVPAFKGYEYRKNAYGDDCYYFNYPYNYNEEKLQAEKLALQDFQSGKINKEEYDKRMASIAKDHCYQTCDLKIYKYDGTNKVGDAITIPLEPEGVGVDLAKYGFSAKDDFVYNYEIKRWVNGNPENPEIVNDSIGIEAAGCKLVKRDAIKPTLNGNGYLAIVDGFAPGYYYVGFDAENPDDIGKVLYDPKRQKEAEEAKRTFGLSYGGSLAGYKAKLDYLDELGVKVFFSTPITGGDDVSYHKYWNTNNFQLAGGVGDMNNFEDFVEDLYAHGMSFVLDVPLTSEGLKGIHYQYALKWGDFDTPFRQWFRMEGLNTNQIGYGLVGTNATTFSHYLVNAPELFTEQPDGQVKIEPNPDYNPSKPTEIQYFDSRYVSQALKDSRQPIQGYDIWKLDNPLEVATHDDTAAPYRFRVHKKDYEAYVSNVKKLNATNRDKKAEEKVSLYSKDGTMYASTFPHTRVTTKKEAGAGYWDANTDMVKRRYFQSATDYGDKEYTPVDKYGFTPFNCQVQDEALRVGDFWGKKFRGVQYKFMARSLGNVANAAEGKKKLDELIASKKLSNDLQMELVSFENIDADLYNIDIPETGAKSYITKTIMSLPLESLELDQETLGVFASPMFTNYVTNSVDLGKSRYQLAQEGNPQFTKYFNDRYPEYKEIYERVNKMFTDEIYNFTMGVLKAVDEQMTDNNKIFADSDKTQLTDYGFYVVRSVGQDVAKYAIMKSLMPHMQVVVNSKGQIIYNTKETRANSSLLQLGAVAHTPKYEAELLADVMQDGLKRVSTDSTSISIAKDAVLATIKDTNVNSFKYAEAITKNSGSNLDTRVDALKDYEDIDSVRNEYDSTEKVKQNLHYFWSKYKDMVYKNSPSARIWGEITDSGLIGGDEAGLIKETGLSSAAGYSFFFTPVTKGLAGTPDKDVKSDNKLKSSYVGGETFEGNPTTGMLEPVGRLLNGQWPVEYVRTIFNFGGNHDKPRWAYLMSVDLKMCHAVLNKLGVKDPRRDTALKQITGAPNNDDLPYDVAFNKDNVDYINKNYFLNASTYAIATGTVIRSKLRDFLTAKNIINLQEENALYEAVVQLVNGNFAKEPVKRPSFYDFGPAIAEIFAIAESNGLVLGEQEKQELYSSVVDMTKHYWRLRDNGDEKKAIGEVAFFDRFEHYNISGSPKQINVLGSIIRDAIGRRLYNQDPKGMYHKFEAAIQAYIRRYTDEHVEELLLKQQQDLSNTVGDEKNCFGCMDIRKAIELVFRKAGMADKKYDHARFALFKAINDPAIEKVMMGTRMMMSFPGFLVNNGGDELAMSGYDEKSKNLTQANREAILFSKLEGDSEEAKYYQNILEQFKEIASVRVNAPVLSNGFPRVLGHEPGKFDLPGLITTGSDGSVAISIFNYNTISTDPEKKYSQGAENPYIPFVPEAAYDEIPLLEEKNPFTDYATSVPFALANGMILCNALNENEKYIVRELDKRFSIKPLEGGKIIINKNNAKHGVLTLVNNFKKAKKIMPKFKGLGNSYSVPQYNIVSNPMYFVEKSAVEQGTKLSIISK